MPVLRMHPLSGASLDKHQFDKGSVPGAFRYALAIGTALTVVVCTFAFFVAT
jgi:hypothetical protein